MSHIAILGAGRVASQLATKLAASGHQITVGTRRKEPILEWLTAPNVHTTIPAAAAAAEIVINATPGETSLEWLSELRPELSGKILIDVTNAVERGESGLPGTLSYPNSSLAETLQEALPATKVVKTLNTMLFTVMANPDSLSTPATVFVSGNHADAKETVIGLLGDLGWTTESILDLGDIRTARGPEAMILFVADVLKIRGFAPFAITIAA
ncbi:NADPH-dependent F420 reductase [Gryllotalpicola reticulitermitis]|uniref:NADPH-dependent F420 reductase n=1 Tax=Gryllotalpicola reticulitermitis TaxID=1184153 RepID=A0ABV8Q698_9MICO